jgi:ABC-2 type transport system permease protein/lipopolysaccharide transport system permease protein
MLARQDFFVRYRRASLGLAWAVGVPLIQTAVLVFVFTRLVKIGSVPHYPVFVLTGMLAWSFFSLTVQQGSTAIVDNKTLSSKIYFPRAVLPLMKVAANLYAFLLSLVILLGVCLITGLPLTARLAWLVPGALLMIALASAFSLVLSALHVYSRDVRYIVQAALIAWFYVTPVFYSSSRAHGWGHLLAINPATGMVLMMRAATTGYDSYWPSSVLWSVSWTVALVGIALALHRRFDRVFADLL